VGCKNEDDPGGDVAGCPFTVDQNGNVVVDLAECPDLTRESAAAAVEGSPLGHRFVLTHTSGDSYRAFDARCTHEGTMINPTTPNMRCPNHGSLFSLNGTVVGGPATRPLTEFSVTKVGDLLVVNLP
jgi:Rieske Fe-S protein